MNGDQTYAPVNPVSVAMTTYNGERFLDMQIQSILAQTKLPAEIIVCDDNSTDNTPQILRLYHEQGLIKYYHNTTRLGVLDNFKKAVSLASAGNYIAICDQDDIWLPEKIETSANSLACIDEGSKPAMVYSDRIMINDKGRVINDSVNNSLGHDKYRHNLQTILFGNVVSGCTVMMNEKMKEFFLTIPYDQSFIYDAWLALIGFSFGKVAMLTEGNIQYRQHDSNVTFSQHRKKTRIQRLWNHFLSVTGKNNFLENELVLAEKFLKMHQKQLTTDQERIIQKFLSLKGTSYLSRKIAFEKAFTRQWISRF